MMAVKAIRAQKEIGLSATAPSTVPGAVAGVACAALD
jgi:hypothetical protein